MAVAGLESIKATSPDVPRWAAQVSEGNATPTGPSARARRIARRPGRGGRALLRMGIRAEPEQKAAILAALRAGQKPDGGWSEGDGPSDLNSSYRIMRAFFMMKEKPDLGRLRGYLARHRQTDGGYASTLRGRASPGGTYSCSIMNYWARLLDGEPALVETAGFVPLFNGKDLTGWEGDTSLWSAKDGMLVGDSPGIKQNQFLATEASYGDFLLKFTVRLVGDSGNSGVQFRSVRVPGDRDVRLPGRRRPRLLGQPLRRVAPQPELVPAPPRRSKACTRGIGTTSRSGRWGITSPSPSTARRRSTTARPTPRSPATGGSRCRSTPAGR